MLARELTKLHEEIFRGTLAEAVTRYGASATKQTAGAGSDVVEPRGEFTLVLGPRPAAELAGEKAAGSASAMEALKAR